MGVFHAGWRGTVKRIVEKGVGEMQRWFSTRPGDLRAAIGPGVHGCCYSVGPEVRTQFESQFEYGSKLFREVEESDPVREKYPLLFLTARAPGHSELPKKDFSRPGGGQPPPVARGWSGGEKHQRIAAVYFMPDRSAVLLSRGKGSHGAHDGGGRNSSVRSGDRVKDLGGERFFLCELCGFPLRPLR